MSAATAKAPTLAWLLTALTCLLVGMAIVESRHQVVALPAAASLGVVEPVESAAASPPTPAPSPTPTALIVDILVPPSAGPATLRVDRLTIPPGVGLPSEVAAGTTVLLVEAGPLTVRVDGAVWVEQGLDQDGTETVLADGERLVIAPAAHYAVRNNGSAPAVALVAMVVPHEDARPMLGPGEPPPDCPGRACNAG